MILACAAFASASGSEPIRTISEIRDLDAETASQGLPVDLQAKVYYFDINWRFFFIGQGDDFICVTEGEEFLPLGSTVRLLGHTENNYVIRFGSVTLLEPGEPDQPLSISFDETSLVDHDCRWVTGECVVSAARTDSRQTLLLCQASDGFAFHVSISGSMTAQEMVALIDSRIRATGNLGCLVKDGIVAGTQLNCPVESFKVIERAEHPVAYMERRSIADTWNDDSAEDFHLAGQVTFVGHAGMFLENHAGGIWIHNERSLPFKEGGLVEVHGSREPKKGGRLSARVVEVSGSESLHQPAVTTIRGIKAYRPESRRVQLQARVARVAISEDETALELEADDGTPFLAYWRSSKDRRLSMDLDTAVDLSVTGTISFQNVKEPFEFAIHVPQDGLLVTRRSDDLSRTKALGGLLVLGPLLVCLAVWGYSQRKQARARKSDLEHISAELRLAFDSIRDGVLILDADKNIVHANQTVSDLAGLDVSAGTPASLFETGIRGRLTEPSFLDDWDRLNASDTSEELLLEIEASGMRRSLEVFTAPVRSAQGLSLARLWAFHDVTEKQQLQASLLHAQKQEAIGRLAGGFAHDFNNLLTGVIANLSLAGLDESKTVGEIGGYLEAAVGASDRAATLVSQLLGFSRKTRLDLKPNDVNSIVVQMEPLLRPVVRSVEVQLDLDEEIPTVRVDATRLEQVLLNICLNAIDAIGDDDGEINIRTYSKTIEKDGAPAHYVVVSIRDTGTGIPEGIRASIFEPFFTTKQGKGTGLGLAMAEGIVHQHQGWLECDSAIGVGTEFRVYLPACGGRVVQATTVDVRVHGHLQGRNVLVVDDEDVVRDAISEILVQQGAHVRRAADGRQALSVLKQQPDIELVILDWTMPGLSGRETLWRIKTEYPTLPVVVCSGFVFDIHEISRQANVAPDEVLQKPFRFEKISQSVLSALEANSSV